ncbi:YbaB/EbfC family nucleoid-associated protein [Clostridium sporogenes]|uniref:YbaB/EbfC family nucleoid-associated protein n=1 Tax=Clostridium sporogenes TaxID=1509 RepID=UPI002149F39B|nr:YbaB/EbfC family nucleoid-associated protein [Clostridium sporogenes]MCR1975467.1 YbaB/EbfC family nucleoid-associated protein [Clostridium sporogenes]
MARGGFPNMGGANMNNLIKQAQKLQQDMEKMQGEMEKKEFSATVGGGAVIAVANGKKQIVDIKIKPEVVDEDDIEMLQDLIMSACNEALKKAEEDTSSEMKRLTGGMNLPGML